MVPRVFRAVYTATTWALRAMFFGALILPVISVVSLGASQAPYANSFESLVMGLGMGVVFFTSWGGAIVALGVLWGVVSISVLSRPWFKKRARGSRRGLIAAIVGLLSGIVAGLPLGTDSSSPSGILSLSLYAFTSVVVGMASTPFIAWAAGWDIQAPVEAGSSHRQRPSR